MSLFNLFKSKEEKLNEAVHEDLSFWRLMCTGIITSPDFFRMFPPKDAYMKMTTQKAWMFAAFYVILGSSNVEDSGLLDVITKNIGGIIEEEDKKSDEPLCPIIDELMDVWGNVTKNLKSQIEYVKSIMNRIETPYVLHAAIWMFCKSFLEKITVFDKNIDFDVGADFLYERFVVLMRQSKTIQVYKSCFKK